MRLQQSWICTDLKILTIINKMRNTARNKIRRFFTKLRIRIIKIVDYDGSQNERKQRPDIKNLPELQACAVDIAVKTMRNPMSKLYYDLISQECYIKREDVTGNIYVFIESKNVKIIDTVFGYDIPINNRTEEYLTWVFRKELSHRRTMFKKEALSKVDFSLKTVLDKINEKYNC